MNAALLAIGVVWGIHLAIAFYAGRDMAARGRQGWAFALLIVLFPVLGILFWLLSRLRAERVR